MLGTQCVCLGLVAIRYFDRRRNQLWVMALVPFWAVAQLAGVELLSTARFDFARPGFLALNLLGCCAAAWVLLVVLRWGALALSLSTAAFTLWGVANPTTMAPFGAIPWNTPTSPRRAPPSTCWTITAWRRSCW